MQGMWCPAQPSGLLHGASLSDTVQITGQPSLGTTRRFEQSEGWPEKCRLMSYVRWASFRLRVATPFVRLRHRCEQPNPAEVYPHGHEAISDAFPARVSNDLHAGPRSDAVGLKVSRDRRTAASRPVQRPRRAQRRSACHVRKDQTCQRQEDRLLEQQREVLSSAARGTSKRLQAMAPAERAASQGDERVRRCAKRGRCPAERHQPRHDPLGATGPVRRIPGTLPPHGARRPRPRTDRRV